MRFKKDRQVKGKNIDWDKIKSEYLSGTLTRQQLCQKYGIKLSGLIYRISKYNWAKDKKCCKAKQIELNNSKKLCKIDRTEFDYNRAHLKMYEDCARIIRVLIKLYLKSTLEPDVGSLQKLVAAIEKIQKGQRVSLGLDKEGQENLLPTLNIVENLDRDKL